MIEVLCIWFGIACAPADMPVRTAPPPRAATRVAPKMARAANTAPKMHVGTAFPPSCKVQPKLEYKRDFVAASRRYPTGADACELARQVQAESNFDPKAVSPAGAMGIAQFMPATAAELGVDPWDARDSIFGMARYVKWCRDRWDPDLEGRTFDDIKALGLACYNWGFGAMIRLQKMIAWVLWADLKPHAPAETRGYVWKIGGW